MKKIPTEGFDLTNKRINHPHRGTFGIRGGGGTPTPQVTEPGRSRAPLPSSVHPSPSPPPQRFGLTEPTHSQEQTPLTEGAFGTRVGGREAGGTPTLRVTEPGRCRRPPPPPLILTPTPTLTLTPPPSLPAARTSRICRRSPAPGPPAPRGASWAVGGGRRLILPLGTPREVARRTNRRHRATGFHSFVFPKIS